MAHSYEREPEYHGGASYHTDQKIYTVTQVEESKGFGPFRRASYEFRVHPTLNPREGVLLTIVKASNIEKALRKGFIQSAKELKQQKRDFGQRG